MSNQSAAHSKLVNQTLIEIGKRFAKNSRAWKNHTGQAFTPGSVVDALNIMKSTGNFELARAKLVPISFGVTGQCDISGLVGPNGRRLEIEVKTGTGRLSDSQKNFRDMIMDLGGLHIELRDLKDLDAINQMELLK
jgi:hypothetical protein